MVEAGLIWIDTVVSLIFILVLLVYAYRYAGLAHLFYRGNLDMA